MVNLIAPHTSSTVNHSRTTFWAMVGPPVAIAVLALIGYVYKTQKSNKLNGYRPPNKDIMD